MKKQPRINRNIRFTDDEWKTFREDMGCEWLRAEIAKVTAKKLKRSKGDICHAETKENA